MKVRDVTQGARIIAPGNSRHAPKVSVITPTYKRNAEGLLAKCIESAIVQSFSDFEYIIIDDGSSDGSEDVIREYAKLDDRIVYIRHDRNSGLPAVRTNEGILHARGSEIAFLFDDNVYRQDFLASALAARADNDCDVVVSFVEMLTNSGKSFTLGGWPMTMELIRNLNTVPNGGVLADKDFFHKYGLYDPHIVLRRVCDWDLWLRGLAMGAKFFNLEHTAATEHGLVSPNSLGNTIASDWKIVYSYMQDSRTFRQRSLSLRPDVIEDVEVLDPTPVLPYVKDARDWDTIVETFYTPFLARHPQLGFDPRLPSNRAGSIDPRLGWNADWGILKNRTRIGVISNTVSSWTSAWLDGLRDIPGAIVLNGPEWALSSFEPGSLDTLVLMDCTAPYVLSEAEKHKLAGAYIIYAFGYGPQKLGHEVAGLSDIGKNSHVQDVVGDSSYFPRPLIRFSDEQAYLAGKVCEIADQVILDPADMGIDLFGERATPIPIFEPPPIAKDWGCKPVIAYRYASGLHSYVETIGVDQGAGRSRCSEESLGSLVESRPDTAIEVAPGSMSTLPLVERIGLACHAVKNNVSIIDGADSDQAGELLSGCAPAEARTQWLGWFGNLARVGKLASYIRRNKGPSAPLRVGVTLNSEMVAGSEVYGVMIARNLKRLGLHVEVFIPNSSPYGDDSDVSMLNGLLERCGLAPAKAAPYPHFHRFQTMSPDQQGQTRNDLEQFIASGNFDILLCAGFMPAFTSLPRFPTLMIFTLFQPNAYRQSDLAALRGYASGIISDSQWSLSSSAAVIGGPTAVVRSTSPFERQSSQTASRTLDTVGGAIRIAIGGTLQPRKRQLEAVQAAALLVREGYSVELNIYGHELAILKDYVDQIDRAVADLALAGVVKRHGMVSLDEIANSNDILLSASCDESLPQTMIEMMSRSIIVVAGLSGGIDEVIIDKRTGYITSDLSPRGLADALRRAIDDRSNWAEIRKSANQLLAEQFSEGATTAALLELLSTAAALETAPSGRLGRRPA